MSLFRQQVEEQARADVTRQVCADELCMVGGGGSMCVCKACKVCRAAALEQLRGFGV